MIYVIQKLMLMLRHVIRIGKLLNYTPLKTFLRSIPLWSSTATKLKVLPRHCDVIQETKDQEVSVIYLPGPGSCILDGAV